MHQYREYLEILDMDSFKNIFKIACNCGIFVLIDPKYLGIPLVLIKYISIQDSPLVLFLMEKIQNIVFLNFHLQKKIFLPKRILFWF